MLRLAKDCGHGPSPITPASTGIARSARGRRRVSGWQTAKPICWRCLIIRCSRAPQIGAIAYRNKAAIYGLLFKAASEAMLTIAADPKHLGARIGVMAVLHTWGSAITHHPHVHMIVPGGGLSLDGERFIACRRGFFLPVRVLSGCSGGWCWKGLPPPTRQVRFLGKMKARSPAAFAAVLEPLRSTNWFVYAKRPFAGRKLCSPICRATPTGSPSRNAAHRL